ncbi:MAG: queG, partial [Marmoricola sp.]|nr:queG [Marmoricola sp.]
RIGHERWQRNVAVAMGNALRETGDAAIGQALMRGRDASSELVREHVDWALAQGAARPAEG